MHPWAVPGEANPVRPPGGRQRPGARGRSPPPAGCRPRPRPTTRGMACGAGSRRPQGEQRGALAGWARDGAARQAGDSARAQASRRPQWSPRRGMGPPSGRWPRRMGAWTVATRGTPELASLGGPRGRGGAKRQPAGGSARSPGGRPPGAGQRLGPLRRGEQCARQQGQLDIRAGAGRG